MTQEKEQATIVAYKGFDKDLKCRGFQYAEGETYEHAGTVKACDSGFHACEYPLDVLRYYSPASSRFFVVEQSGTLSRHDEDTKIASSKIKIGVELNLAGLIKAAVEYTVSRCKPIDPESPAYSTDTNGLATASGYSGAATASGRNSTACAPGFYGKAKGIEGAALFLVRRDDTSEGENFGQILFARAFIVGKDGIKPDVFYTLDAEGEPVES